MEEYIFQLWAETSHANGNKSRDGKCLLGLYTTEEKLKDEARAVFQVLLEDVKCNYAHVYGIMTPLNKPFGSDETIDLEYGLRVDRRKRGSGLFIVNTSPV